uniref:(California timema) hypothetical protein n=1 Tax=Timema californicum TaxID=61474 RepID=A0A7R9J036_TIMCA|nr:unnamed protein product [Timema californicum]
MLLLLATLFVLWEVCPLSAQGGPFSDQKQQFDLQQQQLRQQLQDLQRQWQVAQGVDLQTSIQLQQQDLFRMIQESQKQQQEVQNRLQEELNGLQRPSRFNLQDLQQSGQDEDQSQQQQPSQPQQQSTKPEQQPPIKRQPPQQQASTFLPLQDIVFDGQPARELPSPPCATLKGEAGLCRPLVKCITFYAELPELRRQPCTLQGQELGVCCPLRKRESSVVAGLDRPNNGVLRTPIPPPVVIPPLTPQQLNNAASLALERIRQLEQFVSALFANNVVVQSGSPAAWHQEFFQSTNATLEQGALAQKNVEASLSLLNQFNLTADQGTFALPTFSILNTVIADTCPPSANCQPTRYRSADGACNNLLHDRWGKTGSALQRILPPKYGDGVNTPRSTANNGELLPSARVVSVQFTTDADIPHENYTLLLMQWGQFLDHDLTHTPISRGQSGSGLSCCRNGDVVSQELRHPDCFPIILPKDDHIFAKLGEHCMEFVRSLPAPRPECNFGPREQVIRDWQLDIFDSNLRDRVNGAQTESLEMFLLPSSQCYLYPLFCIAQMNQVSGYLDGSNIYGSTRGGQREIREFTGGRLKVQNVRGKSLLPQNEDECVDDTQTFACFKAGDSRVNEQVDLAVMHTLWMREHNRVATQLAILHPNWEDETLFQEARRIVVGEIQHITYNEFLPLILGRDYMDRFDLTPKESGYSRLYDDTLNAGITNVFSTAAFRFGHTLVQGHIKAFSRFGSVRDSVMMHKSHFSPFALYKEGAFDDYLRGLSTQTCQRFDRFFSSELTDHLFQGDLDFGLDLVALNIQRARDHGLPPYNDWREVCGLPRASSWDSLLDVMDPKSLDSLKSLYGSVDEVDLFVAAVAEKPLEGALLGQTFVCLVGDQFSRLRRGDRFFYEESDQQSSFTPAQLEQLRKSSLARVMCDNSDDIVVMQPLAFFQASYVILILSTIGIIYLITQLFRSLVDLDNADTAKPLLSGLGDSWLFRLSLNLLGYATILVPGFLILKYVRRTNYLEKTVMAPLNSLCPSVSASSSSSGNNVSINNPEDSSQFAVVLPSSLFSVDSIIGSLISPAAILNGIPQVLIYKEYETSEGVKGYFRDSQFLVFVNRILAFALSGAYILCVRQPRHMAPLYKYVYCSFSNIMSSWCQYEALKYVSFPTQVLAKASKIIPVMLMGKLVSRKKYDYYEYITAVLISVGMTFFMLGSSNQGKETGVTTFSGLVLLGSYMLFDSFTSNWQGELFTQYSMSSVQMMCGVNLFSCLFTTVSLLQQGGFYHSLNFMIQLVGGTSMVIAVLRRRCPAKVFFRLFHHILAFFFANIVGFLDAGLFQFPKFMLDCVILSLCSACGQLFIFYTIATFGPVVFVIIMTIRQLLAILLSCLIYHHYISAMGIAGVIIVFVAVFLRIYCNQRLKAIKGRRIMAQVGSGKV